MNERARWRHRRTLYSIIVGLIVVGLSVHVYGRVAAWAYRHYAVTSYVVVSQNLDEATMSAVSDWFDEQKEAGRLAHPDYEKLNAELVHTFPLVGLTVWSRYNPTCLTCKMRGVEPVFRVNKYYVAGDNGRLYRNNMFSTLPSDLPRMRVNHSWLEADRFGQVYAFYRGLPAEFLKTYDCIYRDPHTVVVSPKASLDLPHRCVCLVDDRSVSLLPDMVALMSSCQVLRDDHRQPTDDTVCFFDFRFSGRVISKCITHQECAQLQRV